MRQHTPGEFRAVGSEATTDQAPPDSDLNAKLAEVVGALENLGELGAELKRLFGAVRLSQLANEGRLNVHSVKRINDRRLLGDHERRLREAERFNKELRAELDAMKGTAAE
jgi:hypothetical protein